MKSKILLIGIFLISCSFLLTSTSVTKDFNLEIPHLIKSIQKKVIGTINSFGDQVLYPRSITNGSSWRTVPIKDWTSGFFPGILWYTFEMTKDKSIEENAKKWTEGLSPLQFYTKSHDVGFMVYCSYGNGFRLTKNDDYKKVILQTAQTLTKRFNSNTGTIRSWDHGKWEFPVIIDNMMNLELLFWSSKNGGTKEMWDVAVKHAETTMKNHFREDGSTFHVLSYDTTNGNVISKGTHQGFAENSCWARGQAWAVYGFTLAYRFTKDERFLSTAKKAADYFLAKLPEDQIPYWDFQAPNIPNEPRDASAAAIVSSALFELSKYVKDSNLQKKYFEKAIAILQSLSSKNYFDQDENKQGIISHSVGNMPKNDEVDVSIIYGDYYYVEALYRYKNSLLRK